MACLPWFYGLIGGEVLHMAEIAEQDNLHRLSVELRL